MLVKRCLCIALIIVLAASMMVGCVKDDKDDAAITEATSDTKTTEKTETAKEEQGTVAKEEPLKISIALGTSGVTYFDTVPDMNKDKYVQKINEMANVELDIQMLDHQKFYEQVNLLFASGDLPDILKEYKYNDEIVLQAVEQGLFLDLKPYISEETTPGILKNVPEICWDFADIKRDGGIYFVPTYIKLKQHRALYVRKDLLDEYDLEVPVTLDDYHNVLRTFKDNGIKYPAIGRLNFSWMQSIFSAFGIPASESDFGYIMDEDGNIVPSAITSRMKEALTFLRELYEEGLLDPEFLTNTPEIHRNKILSGDVGMFTHILTSYDSWNGGLRESVPTGEFICIDGPVGPDGYNGSGGYVVPIQQANYINSDVEDPEGIMQFLEWMQTPEATEFFFFGIEGENYTKTNGEIKDYTYPTTQEGIHEFWARRSCLWLVTDLRDNAVVKEWEPSGELIAEYSSTLGTRNGVPNVALLGGPVATYQKSPELVCQFNESSLWQEIAAKIVMGKAEVDEFDTWVETWKSRGGDDVLEELQAKKNDNLYVVID